MSLRIRLRRVGRKKQPSYRIVVMNSAAPRDGAYVDELGFYNPRKQPAELRFDIEKADAWVSKGATLSTTAASLLRKAKKGGDAKVGYQTQAAFAEANAPAPAPAAVAEKPKRRAPAKAGSAGTGSAPAAAEAAAPVAAAPEAAAPEAAPTEGETSAPAEGAAE